MHHYKSVERAFLGELSRVLGTGEQVAPQSFPTTEVTDCIFRIERPRARLIGHPARGWSLPYAIGELFWHLSASDDLNAIAYYSRQWQRFADGSRKISGSCYGHRIFSCDSEGNSLWMRMTNLLRRDPSSRQAVLTLFDSVVDLGSSSKDVPCTSVLQFLVRGGCVNLSVYMRSNDLMLGFGYDIFFFTILQEMLAVALRLELGWYQHMVGSLHVYEKDRKRAEQIANEALESDAPEMESLDSVDLEPILPYERILRESDRVSPAMPFPVSPFWRHLLEVLLLYRLRRDGDVGSATAARERLRSTPYFSVLPPAT